MTEAMGILQVLTTLKGPAIITLGDVHLRVGQSDRDAASALLDFMDEHIDEEKTTYAEVEALLVLNFLEAIQAVVHGKGSMPCGDIMEDNRVRMTLDCLWWYRFLVASRPIEAGNGDLTGENDDRGNEFNAQRANGRRSV